MKNNFLLIAVLCLVSFSPVLWGQFKGLDDEFSIVNNADLRHVESLPRIFTSGFFKGHDYYRPLVMASYLVEYQLVGLNPFLYNLDGLLLHLFNAWLVFLLAGVLLQDRRKAWWVALLFAVHPLHWEAVGNISGRAILLCAAFTLSAAWFFLRYLKEKWPSLLGMSLVCFTLASLTKESAAVLIAVLALYMGLTRQHRWGALVPFFAIAALNFWWRVHLGLSQFFPWANAAWALLGFTTFLKGIFTYLRLIVAPYGLYFDRSVPLLMSFASAGFLATWVVYIGAGAGAWLLRRRIPVLAFFCAGWFFMELLPVAQIVTSLGVHAGQISLAEHFLYIPLIPAIIILVMAADKAFERIEAGGAVGRPAARLVAGGLVLFLVITSLQQSLYASNEGAMLKQSLAANPDNARVHAVLARFYVLNRDFATAEKYYRRAVDLAPTEARYRISLGKSIADQGRYAEALAEYALITDPGPWKPLVEANIREARQLLDKK